jgi:hypothetical protein
MKALFRRATMALSVTMFLVLQVPQSAMQEWQGEQLSIGQVIEEAR